jgi:FMN phosphatase YigB (HAD superfamily)
MSIIRTVLFDVGGVLSHDGHETYLSHDTHGIARHLGLPRQEVSKRTAPVFRKYAVLPRADEAEFWRDLGRALDTTFSDTAIRTAKQHIKDLNREAGTVFSYLRDKDVKVGIISNSTPFFYPVIARQLSLTSYVHRELCFLSHHEGCLKSNGLFEIAAAQVDPAQTFVIDDRPANVNYARKLGFKSAQYSLESGRSLLSLVKDIVNGSERGLAYE